MRRMKKSSMFVLFFLMEQTEKREEENTKEEQLTSSCSFRPQKCFHVFDFKAFFCVGKFAVILEDKKLVVLKDVWTC